MRFPFLKLSSKRYPEPENALVTPPRVTASTPPAMPPEATQPPSFSGTAFREDMPAVPLRLGSILSQLPSQLFRANNKNELSSISIAIPGNLVMPQLASGKITVPLADLVKLLPKDLLRLPLNAAAGQQSVVLPLSEIIASIPAETFSVQHDSVIATDTPEFDALPKLFDDSFLQEPAVAEERAATEKAEVEKPLAPEPPVQKAILPPPVSVVKELPQVSHNPVAATVSAPETGNSKLPSDMPERVSISLRGLIAVLPDRVFACSRADLWRKADFDSRIQIPVGPILPQLKTARLELPLSDLMALVPPELLANPLPETGEETIRMPLEEIVPQLPTSLFTTQYARSEPMEFELADVDIPAPFQEKGAAAESLVPDVDVSPAEIPIEPAVLEDDGLEIFVEKAAPIVLPHVEPLDLPEPISTEKQPATPVEVAIPQVVETVAVEVPTIPEAEAPAAPASSVEAPPQTIAEDTQVLPPLPGEEAPPVAEQTQILSQPIAEKTTPKAEEMQIVPPPAVEQVQPSAQETQLLPSSAEQTEESDAPVIPASPLTPNEAAPGNLERYLVNLNRCAVEDLQTIEGIGPALAKRIIEFRDARGHFSSLEELRQIPGIGRKTFRALTGAEPRALNRLLGADHNRELSLQEVVRLTNTLPGITGCMLAMSNGLFLTGELPPQFDRETISVFAPQLFKKVGHYTRELRVGQIRRFTIFTDQQPLSIFRAGDVYLIVIHDTRHFSKALLRRCERISQEIARLCRQRAVV